MARAGDELVNPVTGLRTVFRQTARETTGELLQVEWIGEPGWTTGPDHLHPRQEERFEVLAGRLGSRVGGVERVLTAGDAIVAPAGAPHAVWNASGDERVRTLVEFWPALRTEIAFETLAALARDGKTTEAGVPKNPLRLAVLAHHHRDEFLLARPPLPDQRAIVGVLAAIGRLLGYPTSYPYRAVGSGDASRAAV